MAQQVVDDAVVAIVRDTVEAEMGPFGLTRVAVAAAPDHTGEAILEIDADYDGSGGPVDVQVMASLGSKLRSRLWSLGEERFPYVRHHFPDDRKARGRP